MRQEPTDEQEEDRSRNICEQCWLGPMCLLFWVLVILACIHGCVKGAECTFEWNANPATEQVTEYRLYCGITLLAITQNTFVTVELPDQGCEVSLVAINANGTSKPATLKVAFIQTQESTTLQSWQPLRGYHREFTAPRRFYRTMIQTPP
jgi:hypothetical protein